MLRPSLSSILAILGCIINVSAGPVSLFIPGAIGDGQPVTADPIGTDSIGYTTWRLGLKGVPSGTFTEPQTGVPPLPSATLVIGSTDAHLLMAASATTVREDCVFASAASGGPPLAFCSKFYADPTFTTTAAVVETVIPVDVQISIDTSDRVGSGWRLSDFPTWMQAVLGDR